MDPRGAVRKLLELHADDVDFDVLEAELDTTAIELLTALCSNLAVGLAAAHGPCRGQARELVSECLTGIEMVLEVWEMTDVEVVGGPVLDRPWRWGLIYD